MILFNSISSFWASFNQLSLKINPSNIFVKSLLTQSKESYLVWKLFGQLADLVPGMVVLHESCSKLARDKCQNILGIKPITHPADIYQAVFFQRFQNIFRTLASLVFSLVCTPDFMLDHYMTGRTPALQQNLQS